MSRCVVAVKLEEEVYDASARGAEALEDDGVVGFRVDEKLTAALITGSFFTNAAPYSW